jgi:hypothetical protein
MAAATRGVADARSPRGRRREVGGGGRAGISTGARQSPTKVPFAEFMSTMHSPPSLWCPMMACRRDATALCQGGDARKQSGGVSAPAGPPRGGAHGAATRQTARRRTGRRAAPPCTYAGRPRPRAGVPGRVCRTALRGARACMQPSRARRAGSAARLAHPRALASPPRDRRAPRPTRASPVRPLV